MANPLAKSLLTTVIENLPDDWAIKATSAPNFLLKQGVKKEELDFSDVGDMLKVNARGSEENVRINNLMDLDKPGGSEKFTKQNLLDFNSQRLDEFKDVNIQESDRQFFSTALPDTDPTTYREEFRTFKDSSVFGAARPKVGTHHGGIPGSTNEIWETRSADGLINGQDSRVLLELQSDLFQSPRSNQFPENRKIIDEFPLKNNWHIKALEDQISKAVASNKTSLVVPLEGAQAHMMRSDGTQKWYETTVRDSMKKIAKRIGGEYTETESATVVKGLPDNATPKEIQEAVNSNRTALNQLTAKFLALDPNVKPPTILGEILHEFDQGDRMRAWYKSLTPQEIKEFVPELSGKAYGINYSSSIRQLEEVIDNNQAVKDQVVEKAKAFYSNINISESKDPDLVERILTLPADEIDSRNLAYILKYDLPTPKINEPEFEYPLLNHFKQKQVNYGQIIFPSTNKVKAIKVKAWEEPPKSIEELKAFERDFPIDYDGIAGESDSVLAMRKLKDPIRDDLFPGDPDRSQILWYLNNTWKSSGKKVWDEVKQALNLPRKRDLAEQVPTTLDMHAIRNQNPKAFKELRDLAREDKKINPKLYKGKGGNPNTVNRVEVFTYIKNNWDKIKSILNEQGTPDWAKKLVLYSGAGAAIIDGDISDAQAAEQLKNNPIMEALNSGASVSQIKDYLINENIHEDEETANKSIIDTLQSIIVEAKNSETTDEQIKDYLRNEYKLDEDIISELFEEKQPVSREEQLLQDEDLEAGIDPELPNERQPGPRVGKLAPLAEPGTEFTEEQYNTAAAQGGQIYTRLADIAKGLTGSIFDDREAITEYAKVRLESNTNIANSLRRMGHNIELDEDGELVRSLSDGTLIPIDQSFWDDIVAAQWEVSLGITGAIGGPIIKNLTALKKIKGLPGFILGGAASIAGAAIGGMSGRAIDTLQNSYHLQQNLTADFYWDTIKDAGVSSAVLDIVGAPVFMLGKNIILGIGKGFKAFIDGNTTGAYRALKETQHLNDAQIDEMINMWENLVGHKAPGIGKARKALHVVPQMIPGAEKIVASSAATNSTMSTALVKSISNRAKQLISLADELTSDNMGAVVKDELKTYVTKVKDFYRGIKQFGTDSFENSSYSFNFDKLAITPTLENIGRSIKNPKILKRFEFYLDKVKKLGGLGDEIDLDELALILPEGVKIPDSSLRSFKDLLDLRATVNDFRFNVKIPNAEDREAINEVIKRIDNEIASAARGNMPDGSTWLAQWKRANTEYSNMKNLEDNILYRALTTKGVTQQKVIRAFADRITSLDNTFMEVMTKLPSRVRKHVEGAVIDTLINKNTVGNPAEAQAINFPKLAAALDQVAFAEPGTRNLKRVINQIAQVFKNDVSLYRVTGDISPARLSTYLTDDPLIRMKYATVSALFNYVKRLFPTASGRSTALIMKVAKVLENPVGDKAIKSVLKDMGNDPGMENALKQLSITYAKFGERDVKPYVEVYRAGVPDGSLHKVKDGKYGKGIYWTIDKGQAQGKRQRIQGKLLSEKVLPSRIAGISDIEQILGVEDFDPKMLKKDPNIAEQLKKRGNFQGVAIDNDVFIFGD